MADHVVLLGRSRSSALRRSSANGCGETVIRLGSSPVTAAEAAQSRSGSVRSGHLAAAVAAPPDRGRWTHGIVMPGAISSVGWITVSDGGGGSGGGGGGAAAGRRSHRSRSAWGTSRCRCPSAHRPSWPSRCRTVCPTRRPGRRMPSPNGLVPSVCPPRPRSQATACNQPSRRRGWVGVTELVGARLGRRRPPARKLCPRDQPAMTGCRVTPR